MRPLKYAAVTLLAFVSAVLFFHFIAPRNMPFRDVALYATGSVIGLGAVLMYNRKDSQ